MKSILEAIISFFTALFAKKEIPQSQETVNKEQSYLPLSWEKNKPNMKEQSEYLLKQIELNWSVLKSAKDITTFRSDWFELTEAEQKNLWAEFFCWLAYYESGWDPTSRMVEKSLEGVSNPVDPITGKHVASEGYFQLSYQDKQWAKPCRFDWSKDKNLDPKDPKKTILDPFINIECAVGIMAGQIKRTGEICLKSGVYWAVLREGGKYSKIAEIAKKTNAFPIKANRQKPTQPQEPIATMNPPWLAEAKLRAALVAKMRSQLGERETHGKNRSPLIDRVNKYTNAGNGAQYCISACVYDVNEVCKELGLKNPVPAECSTQAFYRNAPSKYRRPKGTKAKMGDIGIQQSRNDPGHGHAYMFRKDQIDEKHLTIEANTDGSGGRDGDGWYERTRTDDGDSSKKYLGAVDVAQWILDANK